MKFNILRGIKNASYLAVGNFITQLVSFFGFIYIARKLGPDDYGIYVTVGAFVGIFNILILEGLNKTVLREGSKALSSMYRSLEKTIGVRNILIILAIVVCIICSVFTPYEIHTKLYILLFSFELALRGLKGFFETIYQAHEKMQYISIFSIADRVLFVGLSIYFLSLGYGLLTLFIIDLFSNLFIVFINYKFSQKFVRFNFFSRIQFDKSLLKPALIFSLLTFFGFLLGRIDLLMISLLGTSKDVGLYGIAYKIAHQGLMLRNFTATAFFPLFVKQFQSKTLKGSSLIKYTLFIFGGILVLSLLASFFVEDIIALLFGSEYRESGEILRVLIFYLAFHWATFPLGTSAQATHNEKYLLIGGAIMAGLNIPLNYLLFLKYGLIGIAYSTLVVFSVGSFFISNITYKIMKKQGHLI